MRKWTTRMALILGAGLVTLVAVQAQQKGSKAPTLTAMDYIEKCSANSSSSVC